MNVDVRLAQRRYGERRHDPRQGELRDEQPREKDVPSRWSGPR
jgi:hypothetical protein